MDINVPDLFKGVGTTNKKVIIDIATKAIIKIFLLFLTKFLLREIRKRKDIKIKEAPNPRYEPRVKVKVRLVPIAIIPMNSKIFFNLFWEAKKRETATGNGMIKYSAKKLTLPKRPNTFCLPIFPVQKEKSIP